ncbi:ribonuclease E/G [Caulobacter sp. CCUG 60055]|uniref:Rne/Rng family ribonuclease n=1 Tax=Caulobacter sp. CCUG 60055 TaxID=2100090 RepID=UPI001FA6AD9B|nr:ribonuclease E/G [Caulobacter sp. CCUG 60055]MCI3178745.1 ribonuclease E/G [Caulobacter sp. CCUG 60055]
MSKRMLIDAAHAEETRVVVVDGTRVEEFDFESQSKKQLRGNIYLAKVTRVEPSLQAAFVEYGGNRHGFLAFNEIHPDYYQIPVADREALMREEAEEEDDHHHHHHAHNGEDGDEHVSDDDDDVMEEEVARRKRRLMRRYKIQEVIKRRQIMLVQVVKEERGNKGAALTTYLSLAGRYCVLMPNTARGGGISRKITAVTDRKRLKGVVQSLDVPQGMGLIVRTAGAKRTKVEIKRDYEYLMRLWENIRDVTLHSIAPALIYEEEDLVKRAIRDMYDKDLDGIWVEGEQGFRDAKEFMRMLMPSQAKKIQHYREPTPLFVKAKVEDHLAQIYQPVVPLRSGGYLVINQTEALVAIDVNSGKATRERNIEATALKTNMEAAEEACRQLRLRDLAGLVVIDFIDMDEAKNNRAVEKKLKDCLKDDRARVQMGKISPFGLMEISRQRRRSGVLEGTTHVCEHCQGTGRVRSVESSALAALRAIELEAARGGGGAVTLRVPRAVGLYILNEKRAYLERVNQGHGLFVTVQIDDALPHAEHEIERTATEEREGGRPVETDAFIVVPNAADADDAIDDEEEDEEEEEIEEAEAEEESEGGQSRAASDDDEDGRNRNRRRRRRRGRRGEEGEQRREAAPRGEDGPAGQAEDGEAEDEDGEDAEDDGRDHGEDGFGAGRRRRRRGRRGGRRMRDDVRADDPYAWARARVPDGDPYIWIDPAAPRGGAAPANDVVAEPRRSVAAVVEAPAATPTPEPVTASAFAADVDVWVELPAAPEKVEKPAKAPRARRGRAKAAPAVEAEAATETAVEASPEAETPAAEAPKAETTAPAQAETAPATVIETPAPVPAAAVVETVEVAANEPQPPAEPDPAEITTPPAAPRRGWWRRG